MLQQQKVSNITLQIYALNVDIIVAAGLRIRRSMIGEVGGSKYGGVTYKISGPL
jgi:hypothetical protein